MKTPEPAIEIPSSRQTGLSQRAKAYFEGLQASICSALEELDGKGKFGTDAWERKEGGGGLTRVLEDGAVFEKAGIGVSTVFGPMP
ncbi:MAG: oxygen-dependent coproporphyrinogen oxidase, partial [Bacteroidetes bacterium]|nr:oxygen-dependent coproporphyrinogen oxidase [Bacteroidota bacterium]